MNLDHFGMDTITLAGPVDTKLKAMRAAGFTQVMLNAGDLAGIPNAVAAVAATLKTCDVRPTGFQVLRDFEGLSGHLHAYKLDVAKSMLEMCRGLGAGVLLVCSSTSAHATGDRDALVRDLRKLAMLAVPFGIRIAYEALSWGRHVNLLPQAWEIVQEADRSNLGLCIDSYHILANRTDVAAVEELDPGKIFLVQLSDFLWTEIRGPEDRIETARHYRVFPGEGVHSEQLAQLVRVLDKLGYRGDYSFEVFNDDYRQLPLAVVCERARNSVKWLVNLVGRRSLPTRRNARLTREAT
jgi:sugar phosphate isomerase/epimerase